MDKEKEQQLPMIIEPEHMALEKGAMTVDGLVKQVEFIHDVMKCVMKKDVHYGSPWPGGDKPTLLQAGADLLMMTFRLFPQYEIISGMAMEDRVEYDVKCTLKSMQTGAIVGEAMGSCSSYEKKHWREAPKEHQNTILKIAMKRAKHSVVNTATAASSIFTPDEYEETEKPPPRGRAKKQEPMPDAPPSDLDTQDATYRYCFKCRKEDAASINDYCNFVGRRYEWDDNSKQRYIPGLTWDECDDLINKAVEKLPSTVKIIIFNEQTREKVFEK